VQNVRVLCTDSVYFIPSQKCIINEVCQVIMLMYNTCNVSDCCATNIVDYFAITSNFKVDKLIRIYTKHRQKQPHHSMLHMKDCVLFIRSAKPKSARNGFHQLITSVEYCIGKAWSALEA